MPLPFSHTLLRSTLAFRFLEPPGGVDSSKVWSTARFGYITTQTGPQLHGEQFRLFQALCNPFFIVILAEWTYSSYPPPQGCRSQAIQEKYRIPLRTRVFSLPFKFFERFGPQPPSCLPVVEELAAFFSGQV